jgi:chromatin remodeling complex protein RSC6
MAVRKMKCTKKCSSKKAPKAAKAVKSGGFMAPMCPDETLAAVIGSKSLPRTKVTKKVWEYIKAKNLQDKKNRRMINTDALLAKVCGNKKQVSMFDLTKWVNKHLLKD